MAPLELTTVKRGATQKVGFLPFLPFLFPPQLSPHPCVSPPLHISLSLSSISGQRESHHVVAPLRTQLAVAAGADQRELFAVDLISHRRGLSAGRELAFPDYFSGFDVERAKLVIYRGGDEDEA